MGKTPARRCFPEGLRNVPFILIKNHCIRERYKPVHLSGWLIKDEHNQVRKDSDTGTKKMLYGLRLLIRPYRRKEHAVCWKSA